jgi:hypothetical protein
MASQKINIYSISLVTMFVAMYRFVSTICAISIDVGSHATKGLQSSRITKKTEEGIIIITYQLLSFITNDMTLLFQVGIYELCL